ncbi:MAG: DUF4912 domain-containing protein [Candidatus Omnitrophica bacterium]|nr:DUF4912 domain-containing protein [Candidatus Omnitrophota bacterium]
MTKINTSKTFSESYHLPENYGASRITLISRNPNSLYIYWEYPDSNKSDFENRHSNQVHDASYAVRMYDVTMVDFNGSNANHCFDIDINIHDKSWYVELWSDNVTYCAELGLKTRHGSFIPICRSNYISTPRKGFSDRSDMIWMERGTDSFVHTAQSMGQIESLQPKKIAETSIDKIASSGYPRLSKSHNRLPLSADEIKAYYAKIYPIFAKVKGLMNGSLYRLKNGLALEQSLLKSAYDKDFMKKAIFGSSAEMIDKPGASEKTLGVNQQSSEQQFIGLKGRKFYFEIGTELIVYGRTEPNATVKLGGKTIQLREDGTFSLRFALPDGKIPLNFEAISNDKVEIRAIATSVEREKTKYKPQLY